MVPAVSGLPVGTVGSMGVEWISLGRLAFGTNKVRMTPTRATPART